MQTVTVKEKEKQAKFEATKAKLTKHLQTNMCYFKFLKRSTGQERIALGTLNPDNYTYEFEGGKPWFDKWYLMRYWDIEKNAWRCLDVRNLIEIYW